MLLKSDLVPFASPTFTLEIKHLPELHVCLLRVFYAGVDTDEAADLAISDHDPFADGVVTRYGARLRYECPRANQFDDGAGGLLDYVEMECLWDGTWSPAGVLLPCERKDSKVFFVNFLPKELIAIC